MVKDIDKTQIEVSTPKNAICEIVNGRVTLAATEKTAAELKQLGKL